MQKLPQSPETDFTPYYLSTSVLLSKLVTGLDDYLGEPIFYYREVKNLKLCLGVIAWGKKPNTKKAHNFANQQGLPLFRLEDGFLRSIDIGSREPALSIVVDDLSIYYDGTEPSRLEIQIATERTDKQLARAHSLIHAWRLNRVSKYNYAREYAGKLPERYVFVADQTYGDMSIKYGLANATHFTWMMAAALAENPECHVVVKIHPDVTNGTKQGYFNINQLTKNPRIVLITQDAHPVSLIEHAEAVYCVTSQIGFEALLWGKRVRTFGMPFYAGWGLTEDEQAPPARRHPIALENLVYAALIDYPRYLNPETRKLCQVEDLLCWMGFQRQLRERLPARLCVLGFPDNKRELVRRCFKTSQLRFIRRISQAPEGTTLLVWGNTPINPLPPERNSNIKILRMEDDFLRSLGIMDDFQDSPFSLVLDSRGMYHDPTQASDLEYLLQTDIVSEDLILRAQMLRARIVEHNLNQQVKDEAKYATRCSEDKLETTSCNKILVIGQLSIEPSLDKGMPSIVDNMDLLKAVRSDNPDAYLLYQPPTHEVKKSEATTPEIDLALTWCNEIVANRSTASLLPQVNEVHVFSSPKGFMALLHGKQVTCYGQAFYAGWGLTLDRGSINHRNRLLTLDDLLAATLLLYPIYFSQISERYITAEQAFNELYAERTVNSIKPARGRKTMGLMHELFRTLSNITGIN